ncbi:ubiquinol-cytochrome c reductase subunit 8 [Sistotremastrum suecicum HHB10207 ss-3]|uniref:Cytochrome b-c1 complex subunit 8 n=1 Tax=Sistotremastrum suecicum HHB10207 ss-3 TaxID=1314776 RepID=A0A166I3L3_9AGAM|nr:ubiquinol-cytochrome c reductase subunit 8 [Sistotremastrum suecicum HHB10207 ss-3]
MRPSLVARGDMPGGKHYIGWWGDMGGPKQKGIIQYSLSPFKQRAFKGALTGYVFNGYRRLAGHFPYFILPVVIGYTTYTWASDKYHWLNSKEGHQWTAAHEGGEH